jgi:sigma-B regulation protein RsbQ
MGLPMDQSDHIPDRDAERRVRASYNIVEHGRLDAAAILFAHGFGCDQNMWRYVWPAFAASHRVVLFDHVGFGHSDGAAHDPDRHADLYGYADDVIDICQALGLRDVVFVGHSVSAMIGVLASHRDPERFARLVLICPSPSFIDDGDYVGGFSRSDIAELLESLDSNVLGWSANMAPVIMGNADRPELAEELAASICQADPTIARQFARTTFLSDHRTDLAQTTTASLVLQCSHDALAPVSVGTYVHQQLPDSTLVVLDAEGHCPNLSEPAATVAAIERFLGTSRGR